MKHTGLYIVGRQVVAANSYEEAKVNARKERRRLEKLAKNPRASFKTKLALAFARAR